MKKIRKFIITLLFLIIVMLSVQNNVQASFSYLKGNFTESNPIVLNENELLFLNGITSPTSPVTTAKIYNLKTKKFTDTNATFNIPRTSYSVARINKNQILIIGGLPNGHYPITHTAEIFDLTTKMFRLIGKTNYNHIHINTNIIPLDDGRVFILSNCLPEIYDPKTEKFTKVGERKEKKFYHWFLGRDDVAVYYTLEPYSVTKAVKLQDGRILIIGAGAIKKRKTWDITYQQNAEIFNPKTNKFEKTGQMERQRFWPTVTLMQDGRVLVTGGLVEGNGFGVNTAEIYNPKTGVFSRTGNLNQARYNHGAILLSNGKVLIANGIYAHSERQKYIRMAEVYNPISGKFSKLFLNSKKKRFETILQHLSQNKVLVSDVGYNIEIFKY